MRRRGDARVANRLEAFATMRDQKIEMMRAEIENMQRAECTFVPNPDKPKGRNAD